MGPQDQFRSLVEHRRFVRKPALQFMSQRRERVFDDPPPAPLQAIVKESGAQLVQIDPIYVANEDRCERSDMPRRFRLQQGLSDSIPGLFKTLVREDIRALMKVRRPEADQRILQVWTGPVLSHGKMGNRDIEQLQDFQELLCCERPLAPFNFREAPLGQAQPFGQVRLRPMVSHPQGPDFPCYFSSRLVSFQDFHIYLPINLLINRYFNFMNWNVKGYMP